MNNKWKNIWRLQLVNYIVSYICTVVVNFNATRLTHWYAHKLDQIYKKIMYFIQVDLK